MRWVAHVDMDAFFASAEQLTRPTLAGRPVLVGGAGPRGTVAAASYEARPFGARSAMSMAAARRCCPQAVVLPPRFELYRALSATVMGRLAEAAPEIEQIALDEAYLELVPGDREQIEAVCSRLRARVREATGGLACSVGAGSGKQLAKIASELAKPDGQRVLARDEEQPVLHGHEVRALSGVGPVAEQGLHRIGVYTVGQLAALDLADTVDLFGQAMGRQLHRLARGIDDRPVHQRAESKQVGAETTFPTDVHPGPRLDEALADMARAAHARLLQSGRAARTVTVKVRAGDFSTVARSDTLSAGTDDEATLAATARRLLPVAIAAGNAAALGVRLVGVSYSGLEADYQQPLFTLPGDEPQPAPVAAARDSVDPVDPAGPEPAPRWQAGMDVAHPEHGHGWVQGAGSGRVTVRFETRSTGPGRAVSFAEDDPGLATADPLASLE